MGQLYLTLGFQAAGIIYLIVGLFALVKDNKNDNRILFFAICMSYAAWAVYSSLMNITLLPKNALVFLEIRRFFLTMIYPLTLLFLIKISGMAKESFKNFIPQAFIFLPALIVIVLRRIYPTPLEHIHPTDYGWTFEIINRTEVICEAILMGYAVATIFLLLYLYICEASYKRKRQTYLVMLLAILFSASVHNFTNVMLRLDMVIPFERFQSLPPIGVIAAVPQVVIIYYYIQRNNFLNIDITGLIFQLTNRIEAGIIVENSDEEIIYTNKAMRSMFGSENKLVVTDLLNELRYAKQEEKEVRISIQDEEGKARHMLVSFRRLEDRFGDYLGGIYNMKDATELINSIIELEEAERTLKMQVEERTAELQTEIEIRKESEKKLRLLAYNDSMTNLLNRRSLFEVAEQNLAQHPDKTHAFIFMDINFFKTINDKYGHSEGDRMLITTANRLKEVYKEDAHVARFGGDEFVVFIGQTSKERVMEYIEQMYKRFEEDYKIMEISHHISLSNGIAIYPEDGDNMDRLIKIADERMYDDKKKRKANGEGTSSRVRQEERK